MFSWLLDVITLKIMTTLRLPYVGIVIFLIASSVVIAKENNTELLARKPRSLVKALVEKVKTIHEELHGKKKRDLGKLYDDETEDENQVTRRVVNAKCRIDYIEVVSVEYSEVMVHECRTKNVTTCSKEAFNECFDVEREKCEDREREECFDKLEEDCSTKFKKEESEERSRECDRNCEYRWEGEGNDKRWVVDKSSCSCEDVVRKIVSNVPYLDCKLISRRECRNVPVRDCFPVKERRCELKQREVCKELPKEECKDTHKKVPKNIVRNKPVQNCEDNGEIISA